MLFQGFSFHWHITLHSPFLGLIGFPFLNSRNTYREYCGGDRSLIPAQPQFNSVLSGMAAILFLTGGNRWLIALSAAAIAALSMVMLTNGLLNWENPY